MKKLWLVVVLGGVMATPSVFGGLTYDGTVTMTDPGSGKYHAASTTLGSFDTFCIEHVEYFYSGGTFNYIVNSGAVVGNGGANTVDTHTGLAMDTISIGTAYLYSQFRAGNLQNAALMHDAIWYLEGEGGSANAYYTAAKTGTGLGDTDIVKNQGTTIGSKTYSYDVVALNLYGWQYGNNGTVVTLPDGTTDYVYLNQDMLAMVPEPSTYIAAALLGLPILVNGIRVWRKRRIS
jgi:hypothetical protein